MLENWQLVLKEAITCPLELLAELGLQENLPTIKLGKDPFPLRVPRGFVARMKKGDPNDPLLRQILPITDEEISTTGFTQDPLNEGSVNPIPGLLHKYHGRVLVTLTGACAINCRYCFRRYYPYQKNIPGGHKWKAILNYINAEKTITEVIFSGGDPLLANDSYLVNCINDLATIPHLKTLRIHSRVPIVLPQRINHLFTEILISTPLKPIMVVHCNHANELDASVAAAIEMLREKKIIVLNQSVLLKDINDSLEALVNLSQRLFDFGILPYYLHLLDKVQGAAHFAVSEYKAKFLVNELRKQVAGYLVPHLVKEKADEKSKLPVF